MALADSGRAIGAVTQLLQSRLFGALGSLPQAPIQEVTVGRPEPKPTAGTKPRLNLFLYEVEFDGHLMNVSLDAGQPAPAWLVLRYLMTAFDNEGESDSTRAHEILGQGIRVLQASNFLSPTAQTTPALGDNPDLLKLTFEDASSELLSRLMQGSDERYRCSVAFQVRPVLVAPAEPPSYSLLVGVDYLGGTVPGEDAVHVPVLASLGPEITRLDPDTPETGEEVTVEGIDLHLGALSVLLGSERLGATSQKPDRLTFRVPSSLEDGTRLSAGSHAVYVEQALPAGRRRKSNPLLAGLWPHPARPAGEPCLTRTRRDHPRRRPAWYGGGRGVRRSLPWRPHPAALRRVHPFWRPEAAHSHDPGGVADRSRRLSRHPARKRPPSA